jgi:hypothetical protein
MKSSYNKIKMVDVYQMEEELKQSVIDEIEGQIIKPDEINMSSKGTYAGSRTDICGQREENRYFHRWYRIRVTASKFIFSENENEIMKAIMFGAQIAKQYQSNGQKYQDEMKDNLEIKSPRGPRSGAGILPHLRVRACPSWTGSGVSDIRHV